ncbi:MAG: tRNA pseudouridine(55) synthase TruB [Eubacteriales bacterium]|nr:tRNA pseudouridine(55) synthase TruB [Eubacteriales bacterium]
MQSKRYVLVLDKESGPSSFSYIPKLRRALALRRIGHAGTLDPFATGLMLYAIGPACAALQFMEVMDKSYELTAVFGESRDSYDRTGVITDQLSPEELNNRLEQVDWNQSIAQLCGAVSQTVPIYSAVKRGGRPLYAYARSGEAVELPQREVKIELLDRSELYQSEAGPAMDFRLKVSKGTYIRSFVHDLGLETGLLAYCQDLRRFELGAIKLTQAQTWQSVEEALAKLPEAADSSRKLELLAELGILRPIEEIFKSQPQYALTAAEAKAFLHGQSLGKTDFSGELALTYEGVILGFAEAKAGLEMKSKRVFYQSAEVF